VEEGEIHMETLIQKRFLVILLIGTLLVVILTGCGSEPLYVYSYRQPEQMDDGFEVCSLAQVNMDVNLLESAVDEIQGGNYGEIHSVLIYNDWC
jgi:hypothetical protein